MPRNPREARFEGAGQSLLASNRACVGVVVLLRVGAESKPDGASKAARTSSGLLRRLVT